jgi:hypothetical protein
LNAGWDLTMDLSSPDGDPIHRLAQFAASGPIQFVVLGYTYDLTPRPADRRMFSDFANGC